MPTQEEWRQEAIRRGLIEPTSIPDAALRTASQGLTLGFGDEIKAGLMAWGKPLEEVRRIEARELEGSRRRIREARADRPVTSFVAETAGSLAPGSVALRGARLAGLGLRPALYATQPLVSAVHGAGSGETASERLMGAGVGGALGLAGTGVGEALGYGVSLATRQGMDPAARAARLTARSVRGAVPNERDVARRLANQGWTPAAARKEARRIIESGEAGQFTPEDMVGRAASVHNTLGGTRDFAGEMFPEGVNDMRALASVRGPGQSIVKRALAERGEELRPNLLETTERTFKPQQTRSPGGSGRRRTRAAQAQGGVSIQKQPPPSSFQEFRQRLDVARRGQAREAYDTSRQQPLAADAQSLLLREMDDVGVAETAATMAASRARALSKRLQAAQRRGDPQERIDDLQREASAAAEARDALQEIAAGTGKSNQINARVVEYYDRALGQRAFDAGKGTPLGLDLGDVQKAFRELADEAAPALKQARDQYRGFRQVEEYLESGRAIFKPSNLDDMDRLLRRDMTTEEADAFMVGVLESVEDMIAKGGEVAAITKLTRNQHFMNLLERAAGDAQKARRFRDFIEASARQKETRAFVEAGSPTTRISEDIARLSNEDELGFVGDALTAAQSGNPLPWGARHVMGLYERMRQPGIRNPEVAAEMANMLTQRATIENMQALAARLNAAPRSPIFLPGARRVASRGGRVGAAVAREPVVFNNASR